MPSVFDRVLLALSGELRQQQATLTALQAQMEIVMVKQEDVDALIARFGKSIEGIKQDIADIKATTPPVGEPMTQENFDKIAALAAKAEALDAENPAAPV